MSKSKVEANVGCGGCLSIILVVIALWALCFGVTWRGVHHGLSCSCDKGVEVTP